MKYYKWIFEDRIHDSEKPMRIGEEMICDTWNPKEDDWDKRGGFYFSNEESILRWVSRGDTLCEVEIPEDAEYLSVQNQKTPNGIMVSSKIILKNPIPVSDELTLKYYEKSNMPLKTYFESIGALSVRGCFQTCLKIIEDKVNLDNIDEALDEFQHFIRPWHKDHMDYEVYQNVFRILKEIKSDMAINLFLDKEPLEFSLTDDLVINLTGQTGSGKTTYAREHYSDSQYLVIDTDEVFSEERFLNSSGINHELGEYFRKKCSKLPNCGDDFDFIYQEILDFCKKYSKTIVIDCSQFHCIKDLSLLKGKVILLRTSIHHCYQRAIDRFQNTKKNYSLSELEQYKKKKKAIFTWYQYTNQFIKKLVFLENKKIYSKIKTPQELLDFMSHIYYGYLNKEGRVYTYGDIDFDDCWYSSYVLENKEEIIENLYGNCWDQVELERDWFILHDYPIKTIFEMVDLDYENSYPTHSFLVYQDIEGNWNWFENSDISNRGIHSFSSFEELMKFQVQKYIDLLKEYDISEEEIGKIIIYDFLKPKEGSSAKEYLDFVTSCKEIIL